MRKLLKVSLLSLLLLASVASAKTTRKKAASPADSIREADIGWMKVFSAKDLDKSVAFVAADGSVLAPNAPIATGSAAVRTLFAGFFALPNLSITWQPTKAEVARSGELGYTSGTYQMTFNDTSGKQVNDRGKYVTVWKKQSDGSWKVIYDIFNSDLAAGQ